MDPAIVERASSISSSASPVRLPIPDGGWGWTIVFGSFMISLLTDGFSYTSGVFYEKFLKEYNESEAVTSIFVSVMTGMISVMGPFASGLSQTYGCRIVTIAGALITVAGMVISTVFDHNMYCHAVTLGGLVGMGLGLMFLPQVTIVTEWFDKRLSFATGIAVCGSGFGIAFFALFSDWLIEQFSWRGAMLIQAALMFLCIFFAATFIDPPYKKEQQKVVMMDTTFKGAMREALNFKILKEPVFLYFVIANSIGSLVYYVPLILNSDRLIRLGLGTSRDAATLMIFFGLANGVARTFFGYISDIAWVNRTLMYAVSVITMGVVVAMTTLAQSLTHMQILYVAFGITEGAHATLISVVLVDLFGAHRVYNTLGIVLMFDGLASMIGPPITNLLVTVDDTYQSSIWLCAAITILAGSLVLALPLFRNRLGKPLILSENESAKSG